MTTKSTNLEYLVGNRISFQIGSWGKTGIWNKEELIEEIRIAIKHELYDANFHYNWTNLGGEYLLIFNRETLEPMIKDIHNTLKDYFVFEKQATGEVFTFKYYGDEKRKMIDKFFQENKSISEELRNDYYSYRKKYAGVELK